MSRRIHSTRKNRYLRPILVCSATLGDFDKYQYVVAATRHDIGLMDENNWKLVRTPVIWKVISYTAIHVEVRAIFGRTPRDSYIKNFGLNYSNSWFLAQRKLAEKIAKKNSLNYYGG